MCVEKFVILFYIIPLVFGNACAWLAWGEKWCITQAKTSWTEDGMKVIG